MASLGSTTVEVNLSGDAIEHIKELRDSVESLVNALSQEQKNPATQFRERFVDYEGELSGILRIDRTEPGREFTFQSKGHELFVIDTVEKADELIDFFVAARNRVWGSR